MGTGSPSRRGVRHFWRTLRHSRPFLQKCLRAGNLFFRFAVSDYMCLIQDAFPGIFFELRFRLCFFILNGSSIFLTRKTVFSKKTALSCIFFRISIDNLGSYMCYVIILLLRNLFLLLFLKEDALEVLIFFFKTEFYLQQQFDESKQQSFLTDQIHF